jgi:hypothetical protein
MNFDADGRQIQLGGLFISAKRHSITRPDGSFADFKESILGMYLPPSDNWTEEAWRALGEMWDGRLFTPRPWFTLPAVRALSVSSPAYAREMTGLPGLRPWNRFLAATAIGRKSGEREPRTEVVIAPFELEPERWAALSWRFANSGEPVLLDRLDVEGVQWRLRTLRDLLSSYVTHAIPEMLAPDGTRCGPYTRGVLRRRAIRDGERWLVLKEAVVYGDGPRNAFSLMPPEAVRWPNKADQDDGDLGGWDEILRPALVVVGAATVARRMGLTPRTARAWMSGARRPEKPRDVAQAVVAVARDAWLGLPADEHLRADDICAELPARALGVQFFISFATAMLADRFGGVRPFARALAGEGGPDLEPTIRRWIALAERELRPVGDLNRIIARLVRFSRAEIRKMRRRVGVEPGPAGDRQAIVGYLSLLYQVEKPAVLAPEETLVFHVAIVMVYLLAMLTRGVEMSRSQGYRGSICVS